MSVDKLNMSSGHTFSCGSSFDQLSSSGTNHKDVEDAKNALTKIIILREMCFNKNFRIQSPKAEPDDSLTKTVRQIMEKAFWDKLENDLKSDPPHYDHVFKLIEEIKQKLLDLLPLRQNSFTTRINETLDLELIKQQASNNVFDLTNLATQIIDLMSLLCAEGRDEVVASLRNITDFAELFQQIYKVIGLMSRDIANFYLSVIRMDSQVQVKRERENFAVYVMKMPNALKNTERWLRGAFERVCQQSSTPSTSIANVDVLKSGYLSLLEDSYDYVIDVFPETLFADDKRIFALKDHFEHLVLVASVILSCFNYFGVDINTYTNLVNEIKLELMEIVKEKRLKNDVIIKSVVESLMEQIYKKLHHHIKFANNNNMLVNIEEKKTNLASQFDSFSPVDSHPVYKILKKRLLAYLSQVFDVMKNKTSLSKVEIEAPSGFSFFNSEIQSFSERFSRLVLFNRFIYLPYHDTVLKDIFKNTNAST